MSCISEKTNSSNMDEMTKDAESECKFLNYYKSIINESNKTITSFKRKNTKFNSFIKRSSIIKSNSFTQKVNKISNSIDKIKKDKSIPVYENPKKYRINLLFNNLLIREKQNTFRKNCVQVNSYNMFIKRNENDKLNYVVNNNSSLIKSFLNQTKSNFNNKYKVIYSISSWREKNKIKSLLKTIKSYQNKNNFYDYLKLNILKRCSLSKKALEKMKNKISDDNDSKNKIELYNNSSNDYLNEIIHRNHLIKIRTIYNIKINSNKLRKSNSEIFDKNNTFFQTMPIKKLKSHNQKSFS